jgi:hypothetical protein
MPTLKSPPNPDEALTESLRRLLAKQGKTSAQIDAEIERLKGMLTQQSFRSSIGSGPPSGTSSSPIPSAYQRSGAPSGASSSPVRNISTGGGGCLLSLMIAVVLVWVLSSL